jgi:hypothetical protein
MADSNFLGVSPQSFLAGAAITANRLVELSAADTVTATDAITDLPLGVALVAATAAGDLVPVQQFGVAKLTASAAISVGAQVMPTASGAGKVSTSSGATARTVGVALEAAGADGDIIKVQLLLAGNTAANS